MSRIVALALCVLLFSVEAAISAPIKSYSTITTDVRDDSAIPTILTLDQALAVPISTVWSLTGGAEYSANADGSFFSDPRRIGGRVGAAYIFRSGLYSETQLGLISWFGDSGLDATSGFVEASLNAETAIWYLAFRDRVLFNENSLVSILTVQGKWYPLNFIRGEAKTSLAMETGLGLASALRAELSFAPFPSLPFLFFGAGAGAESYSITEMDGGGRGVETTALGIVSFILDSGRSFRLSAERHFGDRNDDLWIFEAYMVILFAP